MLDTIWKQQLEHLKGLLQYTKPIAVEVLYSMLQDDVYAEKVFTLRNDVNILKYVLDNPTMSELHISTSEAIKRTQVLFYKFESTLSCIKKHEEHKEHYHAYTKLIACRDEKSIDFDKYEDCREVYLDNNSTSQVRPEVQQLLIAYTKGYYGYGNPSTITRQGVCASNQIQTARIRVANVLHAQSNEIVFTSSGTEANNLAIKGIAFEHMQEKGHIITTLVEHPSVLETMKYLEKLGFCVTYVKPDSEGCISITSILEALQKNTILVSVMAANNEIGTLYPLREIGAVCKAHNIPFMVDGIQAFTKIPIDVHELNITLFTFSGHKLYGPKGIGGLYIKTNTVLTPQLHGGGQEKGIRSSTENVGHIIALGLAAELASKEMVEESVRLNQLREMLLVGLKEIDPTLYVYGSSEHRLHGLLSVGFRGVNAGFLVRELNLIGISVSSGSACSSKKDSASHVMQAIGAITNNVAVIRFGLGRYTVEEDVAYVLKYLGEILILSRVLYSS